MQDPIVFRDAAREFRPPRGSSVALIFDRALLLDDGSIRYACSASKEGKEVVAYGRSMQSAANAAIRALVQALNKRGD